MLLNKIDSYICDIQKVFTLFKNTNIMKADKTILPQTTLQLHFENQQPVELLIFTEALKSISSQFQSFVEKNGETDDLKNATLYVKQVREGSIIVELYEFASVGLIPLVIQHSDLVVSFVYYLKSVFEYLKKEHNENPGLTIGDCKNLIEMFKIFRDDKKMVFNLNIVNNADGIVNTVFAINSPDAEVVNDSLEKEVALISQKVDQDAIYEAQYMTVFQARDIKSKVGNKAQIDSLSAKPLNLMFASDEIKSKILGVETNPLKMAFSVDVTMQTTGGIPSAYKVVNVREVYLDS